MHRNTFAPEHNEFDRHPERFWRPNPFSAMICVSTKI